MSAEVKAFFSHMRYYVLNKLLHGTEIQLRSLENTLYIFSDLSNLGSDFEKTVAEVTELCGQDGLNLIINNAGNYYSINKLQKKKRNIFT